MRRSLLCLIVVACVASPAVAQDRMAPGPTHTSNIVLGEAPPTLFALPSIDGDIYELGAVERPVLLLFFRGTW